MPLKTGIVGGTTLSLNNRTTSRVMNEAKKEKQLDAVAKLETCLFFLVLAFLNSILTEATMTFYDPLM